MPDDPADRYRPIDSRRLRPAGIRHPDQRRTHVLRDTTSAFDDVVGALLQRPDVFILGGGVDLRRPRRRSASVQDEGKGNIAVRSRDSRHSCCPRDGWASLVSPAAACWFINWVRINLSHRTATAWDHFFEQERRHSSSDPGRRSRDRWLLRARHTYGEQARDLFWPCSGTSTRRLVCQSS